MENANEYESTFLKLPKYLLISIGCWPKVNNYKILYAIWSVFIISYFLFFLSTFIIGYFMQMPKMPLIEKADIATFILVYVMGVWKTALVKREAVKSTIRRVVAFEKGLKGTEAEDIYKKETQKNMKQIIYLPLVTCSCYLLFVNASLIDFVHWKKLEKEGIPSGQRLKFPEWIPEPDKYFNFYFFYQEVCGFVGGLYLSFCDSLILSFINYTSARIKIVGHEMQQLFLIKDRSFEETKQFLGKIILKHKDIIGHVEEVNKNFKWFFFIDFTIKSYHICLIFVTFFDESSALINGYWKLFKISLGAILFVQVSVLYYQANEISIESQELVLSIYKSEWLGQPIEIIRPMLIMMSRAAKELKLESFGVVILSNNLLIKIYQAAYTYVVFNLCKTIREPKNIDIVKN